MVLVEDGRLINRKGRDTTNQFPEIRVGPAVVLVGEIVILQNGLSQFHMMQLRNTDNPKEVALRSKPYPATLIAFDVLEVKGQDFSKDPLSARRKLLENLEKTGLVNDHVFVADYWGCPKEKSVDSGFVPSLRLGPTVPGDEEDSPRRSPRSSAAPGAGGLDVPPIQRRNDRSRPASPRQR